MPGERGSASVQLVVLLPLLLSIVWAAVGAAMFYYGRTAALAAAQTGAVAGAADGATTLDCQRAAADLAGRVGDALRQVRITCTRTATTVTATVTGAPLSLLPGWDPQVTQQATAPREKLS